MRHCLPPSNKLSNLSNNLSSASPALATDSKDRFQHHREPGPKNTKIIFGFGVKDDICIDRFSEVGDISRCTLTVTF